MLFLDKMVRAWFMDSSDEDQRLEHHRSPPQFIDLEELYKKTGVEYFQVCYSLVSSEKYAIFLTIAKVLFHLFFKLFLYL